MSVAERLALAISILALLAALIPLMAYVARYLLPKVSFRVGGLLLVEPIRVPKSGTINFAVFTESKRRVLLSGVWVEFDPDEVDLSKTKGAEHRITADSEFPVALFFPEIRIVSKGNLQANHITYQAMKEAFRIKLAAYAAVDVAELPWLLDMFGTKVFRADRLLRFSVSEDLRDLLELSLAVLPGERMSIEGPQAQEEVWAKADNAGTTMKVIEVAEKDKK
jgi:hypothetical protein